MDFEVDGQSYTTLRMDCFAQFHVARKLGPVVAEVIPVLAKGIDLEKGITEIEPVMHALAKMDEADVNYVLHACLRVVRRRQNGGAVPVWNEGAKRIQFEDIEMPQMLQIAVYVLKDNLSRFTGALPSGLTVTAMQG